MYCSVDVNITYIDAVIPWTEHWVVKYELTMKLFAAMQGEDSHWSSSVCGVPVL